MKQALLLIFLVAAGSARAQSLDLLTNLHPRPQVSYFYSKASTASVSKIWFLEYDNRVGDSVLRSIQYLEANIKKYIGDSISLYPIDTSEPGSWPDSNIIVIGEKNSNLIHWRLADQLVHDSLTRSESYSIDISNNRILIAGADTNALFDAVSTLVQLIVNSGNKIPALHIYDWPDYPIRWVFSLHNLITQQSITDLKAIEDTMAAHKLNGLQQNDFKNNIYSVFEGSYPQYFYNVDSLQAYSEKSNVELIPGMFPIGWSEGILFHDPDLAEGFPTTSNYYIEGDSGRLVGDPRATLPHGDFENATNGTFPGWNWYDPTIFVDSNTVHSGKYSARATNFTDSTQNGRFIKLLTCNPHSGYHLSAWYKTQGFSGELNLAAIGFHGTNNSRGLTATAFSVPATTSGWQQVNVVFNTLGYDSLYVYCGVWSGQAGTIWMDDFQIEDAGMTNLIRRADDMPSVTVRGKSGSYAEGKDYAPIIDSIMENNQGSYPWHPSPGFKILPGSSIHNGDSVQIHFIRPNPVNNGPNGDGSTMVCVSEDTLYPILHDQLQLVDSQYHANRYFMSHDEIREMNWDSACQNRNTSPAVLLADNARKCDSIIHEVHPGADVFDWSDMFDSLHNAHTNYYLVNGDLTGDWNLLPKDITIVNWNGGYMSQSLDFFSKLGFSQITSPYYDVPNTNNIRAWRLAMDTIPKMRGMMYTTWANDYSFLTPFADYAWSAGPMIVHTPLRVLFPNITQVGSDSLAIDADVFPDPYLLTDSIVSVFATIAGEWGPKTIPMIKTGSNHYQGYWRWNWDSSYTYSITAIDSEHLLRTTPAYEGVWVVPESVSNNSGGKPQVNIFPNPATNNLTILSTQSGFLTVVDALGRTILAQKIEKNSTMDISSLSIGTYNCIISSANGVQTKHLAIIR